MCGIIACIGDRDPLPILISGLRRLAYRGYDSAGVAYLDKKQAICSFKKEGKVGELESLLNRHNHACLPIGIGHTRWATHGEPSDLNAHPHVSSTRQLAIVHNGIIENYNTLRSQLLQQGYAFQSDTDTEVLISLIETIWLQHDLPLLQAVRLALQEVVGTYAVAIIVKGYPRQLIAACKGSSPLVLGLSEDNYYLASDATPIIEYTDKVVYLKDGEMACIQDARLEVTDIASKVARVPTIQKLETRLEAIEKGDYPHFMLKEICTQPESLVDCMRGRLDAEKESLVLGGLRDHMQILTEARRILIVGCGTSWHAGLLGEYFIEELCRVPVEVEYASEFRYRDPIIMPEDVVIAVSQSGETADTLAAIKIAKQKRATVIGLVNVVGSSIARSTEAGVYLHAGPEIGVASTKAFTTQVTALLMIALQIAQNRKCISHTTYCNLLKGLSRLPDQLRQVIKKAEKVQRIASLFQSKRNFLYLGRGVHFPVALEGALKLKEISYIHAEGYPAAEMKHGPIALIDEEMPVVFLATQGPSYEKIISNIEEVKSRKGEVIAIVTEEETHVRKIANHVIDIPRTETLLMPILSVVPLQLLAYYIAIARGCNVDQPRNLAKSVTVE